MTAMPEYSDELTKLGFPANVTYIDLKNVLKDHVESLRTAANQLIS
jgi:hypothetical protein